MVKGPSQLSIVLVAPQARVPVLKYGGTERVLWWLAKGLSQLGHRVSLLCDRHSRCSFAEIVQGIPDSTDVIHYFERPGGDTHELLGAARDQRQSIPWIYTVHGNGQPGEIFPVNSVFISKDHAIRHGAEVFVYNGVDPNEYVCHPQRENYCCFLGKAKWKVKNVEGAVEVARAADVPLKILGGWRLSLRRSVRWLGMVDQSQKVMLLKHARAVIHPVRWHEPFGVTVIEALLSGAPVFATPYGSLPELLPVSQPYLGALATSAVELARRLRDIPMDMRRCREYAAEMFNHQRMAQKYVELYERVVRGDVLHSTAPRTRTATSPEELLPWN